MKKHGGRMQFVVKTLTVKDSRITPQNNNNDNDNFTYKSTFVTLLAN